ncbi:hypothetical protein CBG49_03680 [Capnocytophaga endodontalis]|uniref:Uncharacterized protein n=1 Tax=Capnocytophaga endodontalis TaxID=2708117 RepID=A0A1Z4BLX9_9FLAO|nr:hypothetical protein CBG49_03680 [Capnocytophaga endodontalis]
MRINRDLQENLGETPRCRRGASCAGEDGVGAVGEKLGGTRRNSEGMGGVRVFFGGDVSDGSGGSGESGESGGSGERGGG